MSQKRSPIWWLVASILLPCAVAGVWSLIDGANTRADRLADEVRDLKSGIADLREQKAIDDSEHIKTQAALEFEREYRQKSEAKNAQLESENSQLRADNLSYKEQLKAWSDDVLAAEIAKRVGEEEATAELRGRWHFSLTRLGGERTVGIFKDAETYFSLSENQKLQLVEKDSQISSLGTSLALQTAETKREADGRVAALGKLDEAEVTIDKMAKTRASEKRKATLKGGVAGAVIVLFIHFLFGK